ncbi:MAG: tetratricopeptide repeat protein [Pyrinomonadaceae bacterium]|nr:tetratricopeptide repeat protein [Pyrinomonadaceae bacterium]
MLVVEPSTLRYEDVFHEAELHEDLLERVSALENKLARVTEKLDQGLNVLLQQTRNFSLDQAALTTLLDVLHETKTVDREAYEQLLSKRWQHDSVERNERARHQKLQERIIKGYCGNETSIFKRLINKAFDLLSEGEVVSGIRQLERAAALAPDNLPLNSLLGEHFFRESKRTLAHDYLNRAFHLKPTEPRLCLLLGLACGDEGDAARAKELLGAAIERGGTSYAAHYALGRLFAAEDNWIDALSEFKRALRAQSSPESHYTLGLVYHQLNRDRLAARHLQRCVELDSNYAEALYALGLLHLRAGKRKQAVETFAAARTTGTLNHSCDLAIKRALRSNEAPLMPSLFATIGQAKRLLVSGGDQRLAAALRKDLFTSTPDVLTLMPRPL